MLHTVDAIEHLKQRKITLLQDRAESLTDPDKAMVRCHLVKSETLSPAERFGLANPPGLQASLTDTWAVIIAAKISKPAIIKSDLDRVIQDSHDEGVDEAAVDYRTSQHQSKKGGVGRWRSEEVGSHASAPAAGGM